MSVPPLAAHPEQQVPLPTTSLSGWGLQTADGVQREGENLEALSQDARLMRGLGRSYGDSSLPATQSDVVVATPLADRILAFDPESGRIRAEAGLSIADLNRSLLHRGFFVPVTPGTQYVTLGGAVASDVHGKNHHVAGTFGRHVQSLRLRVASGELVECSREQHPELFAATLGGMGLTGHILEVDFHLDRIPSPWILQESFRVPNIEAYVQGLAESAAAWPMTMGWIDCVAKGSRLGRGILMRGRWATPEEAPASPPKPKRTLSLPAIFPSWTINRWTVRIFNWLYYFKHFQRFKKGIVDPAAFFYPLDAMRHWNRAYGSRGFTQYQCVLPHAAGPDAARRFLEKVTHHGGASFLCVIKDCGEQGEGLLSFPMPGISIAIDFANRDDTPALIATLNEHVIAQGGRIYLTKDSFTTREHFVAMEPRLAQFQAVRDHWDPERRIRSAQSVRLFGDPPSPSPTQEQEEPT